MKEYVDVKLTVTELTVAELTAAKVAAAEVKADKVAAAAPQQGRQNHVTTVLWLTGFYGLTMVFCNWVPSGGRNHQ